MAKKYYTYSLNDGDVPFYIGKGTDDRMYVHENAVKYGRLPNNNKYLFNKINKILKEGNKILYKKLLITNIEQEAYDYETYMINKINISNLCNICEIGNRGGDLGEVVNKKRSQTLSGVPKTKKHRNNLSKALTGRTLSKGQHDNIVNSRHSNGKPWASDEWKLLMSNKFNGNKNPNFTVYKIQNQIGDIFIFNGMNELLEFGKNINKNKKHIDKVNMRTVSHVGNSKGYILLEKTKLWETKSNF